MKKRCKRKVWALVNPITHAIEGAAIITDDVIIGLRTRVAKLKLIKDIALKNKVFINSIQLREPSDEKEMQS